MSLYTKYGDQGYTFTKISAKTPKNHDLIHFLGNMDELNCYCGMLYSLMSKNDMTQYCETLLSIMEINFETGAFLGYGTELNFSKVENLVSVLEKAIDLQEEQNGKLKNFIYPMGTEVSVWAHMCRAVSRKTERSIYQLEITAECECIIMFLNRISDYFFSLARTANRLGNVQEIIWTSGK